MSVRTPPKTRPCERCGDALAPDARSHAKYCGSACRKAASRAAKKAAPEPAGTYVPKALRELPRWVRRSARKAPLTAAGKAASSTDPSTWTTYAEAAHSGAGSGLGFVLSGDGIVCVDLDHCLVDGQPDERTAAFLSTLPPTYIEISPGGDGLHIWGRGMVLTSRKIRREGIAGEVIGSRKYATVTGAAFRDAPPILANIAKQASSLVY